MKHSILLIALVVVSLLASCAPAAAPTAAPIAGPAATTAPAASGSSALSIAGAVDKPQSLTLEALKALPLAKIKAEHPKLGNQGYEGVRLSAILDLAKAKDSAGTMVVTCGDGYSAQVPMADVRKCADCLLAFNAGKLDAVMPGMASGLWARDVVKIELR